MLLPTVEIRGMLNLKTAAEETIDWLQSPVTKHFSYNPVL